MIPIILSQSLWMFSVWLVFTSNLNSQTTWLKVKLHLVNLSHNNKMLYFFLHLYLFSGWQCPASPAVNPSG